MFRDVVVNKVFANALAPIVASNSWIKFSTWWANSYKDSSSYASDTIYRVCRKYAQLRNIIWTWITELSMLYSCQRNELSIFYIFVLYTRIHICSIGK